MVIENEPLYIDLKEFASNHSLDFSEWAEGNLDNSSYSMYITIRSNGEKVANVTFRKINVPAKGGYNEHLNITWTVGWYTGMEKVNELQIPTMKYESGNESDIANFYDILLNKSIPEQKRKKIDLKKIDIKKTAETWDT